MMRLFERLFYRRQWGDRQPDEIKMMVTTLGAMRCLVIVGPISTVEWFRLSAAWEKGWRPTP